MTRYGRKSMLAGSTLGSAPGVGNVFPSMIEVGMGSWVWRGLPVQARPGLRGAASRRLFTDTGTDIDSIFILERLAGRFADRTAGLFLLLFLLR